jgi:hypothetical protein
MCETKEMGFEIRDAGYEMRRKSKTGRMGDG